MTIDPKLFKKYTGRLPGEAMNRMGESLAREAGKRPRGDTSTLGALALGRWYMRPGWAVAALGTVLYFVLTWR